MNAFAALSDPTRRDIVTLIATTGEMTATDIADNFSISPPAISQHLKVLREAEVLQMKKLAQKRLYSINQAGINEISGWILELKKLWAKQYDALDNYLLDLHKVERSKSRRKR